MSKVSDGLQITFRNMKRKIIQSVIKIAGQQQAVKFSHGASLSAPAGTFLSEMCIRDRTCIDYNPSAGAAVDSRIVVDG